jgi:hypothetical protein
MLLDREIKRRTANTFTLSDCVTKFLQKFGDFVTKFLKFSQKLRNISGNKRKLVFNTSVSSAGCLFSRND